MPNFIDVMNKLDDIDNRLEIMEVQIFNMMNAMMSENKHDT